MMGCSGLALFSTAANAQAAPAAADVDTSWLEDIMVTAQRTSEKLQNVPVAVSAFDTAALSRQGITNVNE